MFERGVKNEQESHTIKPHLYNVYDNGTCVHYYKTFFFGISYALALNKLVCLILKHITGAWPFHLFAIFLPQKSQFT